MLTITYNYGSREGPIMISRKVVVISRLTCRNFNIEVSRFHDQAVEISILRCRDFNIGVSRFHD